MGLLSPGRYKTIIGLTGIKYFNAMLADLVNADGWGRNTGDPREIFIQIHRITDPEEENYGDLGEERISRAREQTLRWGISYEIVPTDTDFRLDRVMIDNLDVLIDDLRSPVYFANYNNAIREGPRNKLIALLMNEYAAQQEFGQPQSFES